MRRIHYVYALLLAPVVAAANAHPKTDDSRTAAVPGEPAAQHAIAEVSRSAITYDDKGRVSTRMGADGSLEQFIYHPHTNKLIIALSKDQQTVFHYNDRGDLTQAQNNQGQRIDLRYDERGLIRTLTELNRTTGERRKLAFKYNALQKPVEITLAGVGKITVVYDDQGEISKVSSKQGARMALQVTAAFQTVLAVVRVADVGKIRQCR